MSNELRRFERGFMSDPALRERILTAVRRAPAEPGGRVIRCSRQNTERAVARAISKAVVSGVVWRIEMEGGTDVPKDSSR